MKKLLLVIDMQNAFINENTKHIIDKINKLIDKNKFDDIVFTKFINYNNSIYTRKLNYYDCIDESSNKLIIDTRNYKVINKKTYTALNDELKKYLKESNINEIYLCGIDTECCILKTAFDLFENEYNVYVLKDYCACTYGIKRHNNALEILKRNIGKDSVIDF